MWQSKKQPTQTLSTAVAEAVDESLWIRNLLDCGITIVPFTILREPRKYNTSKISRKLSKK